MKYNHFSFIIRDFPPEDRLVQETIGGDITLSDKDGFVVYRKSKEEFLQDLMGVLNIRWKEVGNDR